MTRAKCSRFAGLLVTTALVASACNALSYAPGTPRPSWCDPTDTAVNDGHTAAFFANYGAAKGPLSQSDCQMTVAYLNTARDYVAQFPTVAAAEAAGWIQGAPFAPGQGVHFVDPTRLNGPLDLTRPNTLLYNGTADTANLAGMMYSVENGTTPPAGFPGSNDHWHNHGLLCYDADAIPFVLGENLSDAFCNALGGVNIDGSTQWMVHAWLPTYGGWNATDIFNNNHPSLI